MEVSFFILALYFELKCHNWKGTKWFLFLSSGHFHLKTDTDQKMTGQNNQKTVKTENI